ncbi:MAG: NAD(P)/FAD-dependent oxidoreductase [Lachnospiraceae bacterium]|nr:NAD(P)/FAD-dependent oxidoreductase [Lachnospiraceae bacterium]
MEGHFKMQEYDAVVIGAGVTGCAIARELARYDLRICVVEKCEDVCCGTSKANSAIIHAGYDAKPGSLKAKLNVMGNSMMDELSRKLDFHFKRIGSLVVMYEGDDRKKLEELYDRGVKNGVENLRIIEKDELMKLEPNLADTAVAALWAPGAGIVCPFGMTVALAENAYDNGAEFMFDTEVLDIKGFASGYEITVRKTDSDDAGTVCIKTRSVINAAGVYADEIHNMVSGELLNIRARRGCYFLLDKQSGNFVNHVIFTLPTEKGKGILTSPTVHGNLIVGPDALDTEDKESTCTTAVELDEIRAAVNRNLKKPPMKTVITSFAGLRATEAGGDFCIGEVKDASFFFDAAGIESPGLSAAPAVGKTVAVEVASKLGAKEKAEFKDSRKGIPEPASMTMEERNALIAQDPAYGNIICRCEGISEGEIVNSIRRSLGARSLDGVKRRVRAGMGRCQAGFCSPRTMEILARELKVPFDSITKSGGRSRLIPEERLNEKYR